MSLTPQSSPTIVQGQKSSHVADDPRIIVVNCPHCGFRFGLDAPGLHHCRCNNWLDVKEFEGRPQAPKQPEPPAA